jgi:hypothetical protein
MFYYYNRTVSRFFLTLCAITLLFTAVSSQEYATLYVYRIKQLSATGVDYKIYLNKLEVAQIANGGRLEYRIYKEGRTNVMVGIFSDYGMSGDNYDNTFALDIKRGTSYYLRGKGRKIEIVTNEIGKQEFDNSSNFKGEINFIDDKPFDYDAYNSNKSASASANTAGSANPPKIVVTDPKISEGETIAVSDNKIAVKGMAGSTVGIKEVKINGEDIAVTKDGEFTGVVTLASSGKTSITVTASDIHNQSSERTFYVEKNSDQPAYRGAGDPLKGLNVSKSKDLKFGKYYALIVGVDKYSGTWPPLQNAVNDAKAIEALMKSKYQFESIKTLYNEAATRTNIIKEFEWLVDNVKPEDNVLIYYSGHGELKKSLNKGYWVPADATTTSTTGFISNSDIQTYLAGIQSKHTLLISDACFSGDIFRGNTISVPFEESEKYYKEVHSLVSRQAMTSGGIEPVMDGGKDGHSVFAYYFLKTLSENQNKYFDAGQLYNKIKIPVINNSEQSPKLAPIKDSGDEGGQFIFIKK